MVGCVGIIWEEDISIQHGIKGSEGVIVLGAGQTVLSGGVGA